MPDRTVLHILSQRPGWTGSGIALDAIVRNADRAGWSQHAIVGAPGDDPSPALSILPPERIWPLVFEREPLSFRLPGMSDVMPYPSSRFAGLDEPQLAAYREAWRRHVHSVCTTVQPDIIHSHHLWLLSGMLKDVVEAPVITHCHGTGLRQLELCPHLADEVRQGCRRNDGFLVLHQGHADQLVGEFSIPADRIRVIGNGYRPDIFHCGGRERVSGRVVTYAGKLSDAKGVPWLIEAADRLADRFPDLQLNLVGSGAGDEAERIRQMAGARSHIQLHGQLSQQQLADLLRRSAVFVLPSFFEGLPLVLVEAAACGCRLVSTSLPGVVSQLEPVLGDALQLTTMPRMASADRPVADDLPQFVVDLAGAIQQQLAAPALQDPERVVAAMSWESIFRKIERQWLQLIA